MDPTIPGWASALTPMNGSDQALPQTFIVEFLIPTFLTLIPALGGLAGNAVVLWVLGFRLRRNAFSVYILNLAGADFLFLSFQTAFALEELISSFHSTSRCIPSFVFPVLTFAYLASLSILSAISVERCLSVLWPIWYRCHRPRHTSAIMCALLWALSLLLSLLEGRYCGLLFRDFDVDWCLVFDFITAAWLIFLFVLLSGSSLALMVRLLCGSQRMRLTRLYVTVVLTVLAFLLCGLPFGIHWFLLIWVQNGLDELYYLVVTVLSCVGSCANPIIYFFVGSFRQRWPKKHKTLQLLLQRAMQDASEVDESQAGLPQKSQELSGSSLLC
ncbi:mas-related G-protein coupled receptor member X2 [Manis javanica]|uniref:mas-related G-protein coupled receptor member X2 n=1 Tax=Manis javanica TaxID=9974 RepID=UPI003C6CFFDF